MTLKNTLIFNIFTTSHTHEIFSISLHLKIIQFDKEACFIKKYLIKCPCEYTKIRVINCFSAFFAASLRAGGWRSLMLGAIPNVQRSALVNLGDLTTYDTTKVNIYDFSKGTIPGKI